MNQKLILPVILVLLLTISTVSAAGYVKFADIDGESKDQSHDKWCDILSFNQVIHKPGGGATGATRRRAEATSDIILRKQIDKTSPKIQEAMLRGTILPTIEIHIEKPLASGVPVIYYTYELTNAQITDYYIGDERRKEEQLEPLEATVPIEEIKITYEEIKVRYTEFDEHGQPYGFVEYIWNFIESLMQ